MPAGMEAKSKPTPAATATAFFPSTAPSAALESLAPDFLPFSSSSCCFLSWLMPLPTQGHHHHPFLEIAEGLVLLETHPWSRSFPHPLACSPLRPPAPQPQPWVLSTPSNDTSAPISVFCLSDSAFVSVLYLVPCAPPSHFFYFF